MTKTDTMLASMDYINNNCLSAMSCYSGNVEPAFDDRPAGMLWLDGNTEELKQLMTVGTPNTWRSIPTSTTPYIRTTTNSTATTVYAEDSGVPSLDTNISEALGTFGGRWQIICKDASDVSQNIYYSANLATPTFQVTGEIKATEDIIANTSDGRLKENWAPFYNVTDTIRGWTVGEFSWNAKSKRKNKGRQIGLIAQEVQKSFPHIVKSAPIDMDINGKSISGEDYLTIQYDKLSIINTAAIQELIKEIDSLKEKVNALTT